MRRRTLEKLAFALTLPTPSHDHGDDDCPMCRGDAPIASFFPDAEGNPPTGHSKEFLVKEAIKARKTLAPEEEEAPFIQMGLSRGGRLVRAQFSVDREGAIFWTFDGKRTLVAHIEPKPELS